MDTTLDSPMKRPLEQADIEAQAMEDVKHMAKRDKTKPADQAKNDQPPPGEQLGTFRPPQAAEYQELPPQSAELKAAQALLGHPVRASIGGHMATIFLTDYDIESDTYYGLLVRCRSMEAKEPMPHFEAVTGLRPYPYEVRPDYAFQFVVPGVDESPLINIAGRNAWNAQHGGQVSSEDQGQ